MRFATAPFSVEKERERLCAPTYSAYHTREEKSKGNCKLMEILRFIHKFLRCFVEYSVLQMPGSGAII